MKSLCYSSACIFSDVFCNQKFKNMFGCTKQTLDKLQRVLNSSARVIFGGDSRHHVTPLLRDHLHALAAGKGTHLVQTLPILVYKALHSIAPCYLKRCALLFPLFPTFLPSVPLLVVIWSYPEQGTTRQPGIFCGSSGRLGQSTTGHRSAPTLSTFKKSMLKTHLFSHSYFTD